MVPAPAVVIVVRHGARLDAADKQWHLKSPTPYDPPLTYGGWTQCRNLGSRIAALLQTREQIFNAATDEEDKHNNGANGTASRSKSGKLRRKKHRVIIHSSPFVRCVQTGIAIGSGMSQYNGFNGASKFERTPPPSHSRGDSSVERSSRPLSTITDEDGDQLRIRTGSPSGGNTRIKLRIDAFLGEWLSPEYYESITPPPDSVLMLAGAKAELLHRGEPISAEERRPKVPERKNSTTGLWGSPTTTPTEPSEPSDTELAIEDKLDLSVTDSSTRPSVRDRSLSASGDDRHFSIRRLSTRGSIARNNGYVPPTPIYAVSPQDPIPPGYVAHARDHCVDVDIHWDSMRPPQNWGDGGKYGEEWSAMHRRFRHGLEAMISWYRHHVESSHQIRGHLRTLHPRTPLEEEDADTDTVLILVSHGAGCNALIGALTNQPVLLDIGMASLTMAVRRERQTSPTPPVSPTVRRANGSGDFQISQEYELALTASTDHLRGSSASSPGLSPLEIASPTSLRSLAPGLLHRSNTLPLRSAHAPPARHITPAPSKMRSTSLSKVSFVPSPLGPGSSGDAAQVYEAKTWLETHQKPASPEITASTASKDIEARPGMFRADSAQPGTGLWSAKTADLGPGLWQRPTNVPTGGLGTAALALEGSSKPGLPDNTSRMDTSGTTRAQDPRVEQWMGQVQQKPRVASDTEKQDAKSVKFADSPSRKHDPGSVSPHSRAPTASDDDEDRDEQELGEELSRWHDEERAGEHAPRLYKTQSELKMHEMGMKRRWTMNDERNQQREKEEDWRMEAWM